MFNALRKKSKLSIVFVLVLCLIGLMTTKIYAEGGAFAIDDISYETLEEAVEAAEENAIIQLQRDYSVTKRISIPGEKQLTFDLGGFTLTSECDEASQTMLSISGEGRFTLRNGSLTAIDKNGDGVTGGALSVNKTGLVVEEVRASGFHKKGDGAVIDAEIDQMTLNDNIFSQNSISSGDYTIGGGAIDITTKDPNAKVEMTGNTLEENKVDGLRYGFGGAVSYSGRGEFILRNNTFRGNAVSVTEQVYGYNWSHGGALSITAPYDGEPVSVTLEGNTISNNKVQLFGGGIYFNLTKKKGDQVNIKSGLFEGNYAGYAGGAIDYSVHGQPTMYLNNAVITDNKAVTGAGVWACPSALVESYSTFGASISGNHLLPPVTPPGTRDDSTNPFPSGTDVRFEGADTTFKNYLRNNNPDINKMTLTDRTFLGDLTTWYKDNMEDLYEEGDTPLTKEEYTEISTTIGVLSALPSGALSRANEAADVIIRNNTAAIRGGAISTNSDIIVGKPEDVSLQVKKSWVDQAGKTIEENLPESIQVTLVQVASNGQRADLETVTLTAKENWTWTFDQLPSKAIIKDELVTYSYEVRETSQHEGYKSELEIEKIDDKTFVANLKNIRQPEPTPTPTPSATPTPTPVPSTTSTTQPISSTTTQTTIPPTTTTPKVPKTGEANAYWNGAMLSLVFVLGLVIIRDFNKKACSDNDCTQ